MNSVLEIPSVVSSPFRTVLIEVLSALNEPRAKKFRPVSSYFARDFLMSRLAIRTLDCLANWEGVRISDILMDETGCKTWYLYLLGA